MVRVTDAMALPDAELGPTRELIRRVDGLRGQVPMRWRITPAFGYGARAPRLESRGGTPVATDGPDALAVCSWDAGEAQIDEEAIFGRFEAREGSSALIALCAAHQEPLVFPRREDVEGRLEATSTYWRRWAEQRAYGGPWRDAVIRSALALKLLVHAPSGAIAAAASASLPEEIGGERNWDYRFCWVRDSAFTLGALLELGCPSEAEAFFWWLLHASQLTHPRLQVLYRLNGGERAPERTLELARLPGLATRYAWATTPPRKLSSTSTATFSRPPWSTRRPEDDSTARRASASPATPTSYAASGASPTPESGR